MATKIRNIEEALYKFFSSFELPAYRKDDVPDEATMPYITYDMSIGDWKYPLSVSARLWYKGKSYSDITDKADEIADSIGDGKCLKVNKGAIYLFKDTNFAQFLSLEKDIKSIYLSMVMQAFC